MHIERYILWGNWPIQLWRLWGSIICCLKTSGPEKIMLTFQSKPDGLRTKSANSVNPNLKVWEPRAPMSKGKRKMSQLNKDYKFHLFLFALLRSSMDLIKPTHIVTPIFFSQSANSYAIIQETLLQTHTELKFYQVSEYPLAQSS
jgi:hypothetical protein